MSEPLLVFLAGLAGSLHCIGMCGGFACALGPDARGRGPSLLRHLVYNAGRVGSYCFIGTLVGTGGWLLVGHAGEASPASAAQRALALLSGLLMLYIGLQFVGWLAHRPVRWHSPAVEPLARALRRLVAAPGLAAPLVLGAANGLLPCPLVYAFAAQAAASGSALGGLQVMAAFGLGTLPAMLAMGGAGLWLRRGPIAVVALPTPAGRGAAPLAAAAPHRPGWRLLGVRVAGAFIVALGLVTLARGLWPMSAHLAGH